MLNLIEKVTYGFSALVVVAVASMYMIFPLPTTIPMEFVPAVERVGPRSVDDRELTEGLDGSLDLLANRTHWLAGELLTPGDVVDLRGRRRDALGQHLPSEEGVDEGALAGIELADHHEQEELIELVDRVRERPTVVVGGLRALECGRHLGEELALGSQKLLLFRVQNRFQHAPTS